MTMAKLMALSLHQKEVTIGIWKQMTTLDAKRKARAK
jgi:hypothetical protein